MVQPFKRAYPKFRRTQFVFNFQGTQQLVAQIEAGAPADVFAGASTKYGDQLVTDGWVNPTVNFCQNRLIVIMPKSNPAKLHNLSQLANTTPGAVEISIGQPSVPVGTYTLTVLGNLNARFPQFVSPTYSQLVQNNVVSEEANVSAIVALVELNEVDAGFVYVSDAQYAGKNVTHMSILDKYQSNPLPTYPIATLKATTKPARAAAFMQFVLGKRGQAIMKRYGFLPKPIPVISTLAPKSGLAGSTVTITGKNFGTKGTVKFGNTVAATTAWTPTSITATVPASLAAGTTKVTVTSGGLKSKRMTFTVTT